MAEGLDLEKIASLLGSLPNAVPGWAQDPIRNLLSLLAILFVLEAVLRAVRRLASDYGQPAFGYVQLLWASTETRQAVRLRRRLAQRIGQHLAELESDDEWSDEQFTELDVEIEVRNGKHRVSSRIPFRRVTKTGLWRERSLYRALLTSLDPLVVLEGEPGSGKSLALRRLAKRLARNAERSNSRKSLIPLYVNLKELTHLPGRPLDGTVIKDHVLRTASPKNDSKLDEFLTTEFQRGLDERTWLFLFDSFDELPGVLASTGTDVAVQLYAEAISEFMKSERNSCHAVVASRAFRGPDQSSWPKFTIQPLSWKRRRELVQRTDLPVQRKRKLLSGLPHAELEIQNAATNPMYLGLLCQYLNKPGREFPDNMHKVFDAHVSERLTSKALLVEERFGLGREPLRFAAEALAFTIANTPELTLAPEIAMLGAAVQAEKFPIQDHLDAALAALEYVNLGRIKKQRVGDVSARFEFSHRRFQEYFATEVVRRAPQRVPTRDLLLDGRWRETAVVLLQANEPEQLPWVFEEVRHQLSEMQNRVPGLYRNASATAKQLDEDLKSGRNRSLRDRPRIFNWPDDCLHLLQLLQDGLSKHLKDIPNDIKRQAGAILLTATMQGSRDDARWALEVAGTAQQEVVTVLLRLAFRSNSQWLRDVAYRQVALLSEIPADIASQIRNSVLRLATTRQLGEQREAAQAHIARLDRDRSLVGVLNTLLVLPLVDALLLLAGFIILAVWAELRGSEILTPAFLFFSLLILHLVLRYYLDPMAFTNWLLDIPIRNSSSASSGVIGLALMYLYLRLWVAWPIVLPTARDILGSDQGFEFRFGVMLAAATVTYLVAWAPMVLMAAAIGRYVAPPVILLVSPLWPVIHLVRRPMSSLRAIVYASAVFIFGLTFVSGIVGLIFVWVNIVAKAWPVVYQWGNVVGVLAWCLVVALWFGRRIGSVGKDTITWQRVSKTWGQRLAVPELVGLCASFSGPSFIQRSVKKVREEGRLIDDEDNEALLREFALIGEQRMEGTSVGRLKEPRSRGAGELGVRVELVQHSWPIEFAEPATHLIARMSDSLLDEFYILLNETRARRRRRELLAGVRTGGDQSREPAARVGS